MPNMSYCRFQNTLGDLQDCYAALSDMATFDALSPEERRAAESLIATCRDIAHDFDGEIADRSGR